jgi:hypothetical protein
LPIGIKARRQMTPMQQRCISAVISGPNGPAKAVLEFIKVCGGVATGYRSVAHGVLNK